MWTTRQDLFSYRVRCCRFGRQNSGKRTSKGGSATIRNTLMYKVITSPATIAVDLQEAKNHLKVDTNADDQLIESLIKTATETVEHDMGRCLLSQRYRESWNYLPMGAF